MADADLFKSLFPSQIVLQVDHILTLQEAPAELIYRGRSKSQDSATETETMSQHLEPDPPGFIRITLPRMHTEEDVRKFLIHVGDVFGKYKKEVIARVIPVFPVGHAERAGAHLLSFHPQDFWPSFHHGNEYLKGIIASNQAGIEGPLHPSISRKCGLCKQTWPSFVHFVCSPSAPSYLRCPVCTKRIPVGADIHILRHRKAQDDTVSMDGAALELAVDPNISTKQRCTARKCPLRHVPHPVGLFSYGYLDVGNPVPFSWVSRNDADPNTGIAKFNADPYFWGGNHRIPTSIRDWAAIIVKEEAVWRSGNPAAIKKFCKLYPRETIDGWRNSIKEFRRYHCGYELISLSRHLQRDILPENLRLGKPGSKSWINNFIAGLPKVPVTGFAEDDRECFVCKVSKFSSSSFPIK